MVTAEAMYAMPRMSYPQVSQVALTSLGEVITDTEFLTLEPSVVALAVEIVEVEVRTEPIAGAYAQVWVHLKANAPSPTFGSFFCRIIDDDTGAIVGKIKDWILVFKGNTWIAKYTSVLHWNAVMPNRVWNLRVEVGTR